MQAPDIQKSNQPTSLAKYSGLTNTSARQRLKKLGFNEPITKHKRSIIVQFLLLFAEPLIIILLIASTVSLFVGDKINAIIIFLMVFLGVVLNFIQTLRSEKAAESLQKEISLTATVFRDGEWQEIPRREVVVDDLIRLTAGDLIPADARLVEARDLHVQEAALTGESLPVEKEINEKDLTKPNIFLGTSVISGTGTAVVLATGGKTMFGDIAKRLAEKVPETDFERGTRKFGYLIMRVVFVLVIFVLLVNVLLHRDFLESLFFSIALAVGLTPEFLPMITAVTLGQGAVKMAKQKVIVKHLAAMQNLGSMDILCSDKTGTLTSGELSLEQHTDPFGKSSERVFELAYLNSFFETGIINPLNHAIKNKANPLDEAIVEHDQLNLKDFQKMDEIPFDFERRRVSVVIEKDGKRSLISKGAPESVFAVCSSYELDGKVLPFDKDSQIFAEKTFNDFSQKGLRVLAVAYRTVGTEKSYQKEAEKDLILAGFLTFADAPLESAAQALKDLAKDGVQVKIITGDNELVARHVCEQVGLVSKQIVLGDEIDKMTDSALAHIVENVHIFARVSPMQKNRILLALKARGHVVGYLGDGINDAPSLRSSDVGISVSTATDVAKDAAEIVLLERSLKVLHKGILEGRKSFGNVMKYLLMGTSSNFGNMLSMAGATLFLPFLPMLPVQIILNNFLYDLAQVTIPTDNVDTTYIRKPQHWDIKLIRDFMFYIGPISSIYDFLTFYILLRFFQAGESEFHTGWFVESLATQTAVVFIIRTAGNPFKSRPSLALSLTVLSVIVIAVVLPFSPLAGYLGFVPLPFTYFLFLGAATITYLLLVELVKRRLMKK
ncbi:MAG TPA: magnesium-translocating P-type ATPase [Pyrinomonadaceae bacterium]|nr:magnesium-translocating P-type ATPase [Pyrinomonadaceae bacterium]